MKHSQAKRILSFLLATLMLVSVSSVMASARWSYDQPYDIQKGKAVMNSGQSATMVCDFLDEFLNEEIGVIVDEIDLGNSTIWLDLSSIDMMATSLYSTFSSNAKSLLNAALVLNAQGGGLGDLMDLNVDALGTIHDKFLRAGAGNYPVQAGTTEDRDGKRDIYVLQNILIFLSDNKALLSKLLGSHSTTSLSYSGKFDFAGLPNLLRGRGLIGAILKAAAGDMSEIADVLDGISNNSGGWLKEMLLPSLMPDADPSTPLDQGIEDMLNELLGPLLGDLLPGVTLELDIYQSPGDPAVDSMYDMLRNVINTVLEGALPMLTDLLAPLMCIGVDDARPYGYFDESLGDSLIAGILWTPLIIGGKEGGSLIDGLLSPTPIPHSEDPGSSVQNSAKPLLMLQESLQWLLIRSPEDGTSFLDRFMLRNYPDVAGYDSNLPKGLIIKDAPEGSKYNDALQHWLGDLIDTLLADVLGMLNVGIEIAADDIRDLSLPDKIAFILKALLPMFLDYMYVPDEAETMREIATYILVDMMSDIVPEKRYDLVSSNPKAPENEGKTIPMDQASTGTRLNPSYDGVYVVLGDLLRYYINPEITNLNLPANKTFDGMISALSAWLFGSYGGLLRTPLNANEDGWSRLSYILFGSTTVTQVGSHENDGILRLDWLTEDIVTSGGGQVLKEVLVGRLLEGVLELDFKKIFSIFQGNTNGELNLPPVQLILRVVARLLNSVLKIPSDESIIDMNLTTLDGLLTSKNLGRLIYYFCQQLGNPSVSSNLLGPVLPLVAGLIGLWDADDYLPHLVTEEEVNGIYDDAKGEWIEKPKTFLAPADTIRTATAAEFRALLNLVHPIEQTVEWDVLPDPNNPNAYPYYHYFDAENFLFEDQYRFNFYEDARDAALSVMERLEAGEEVDAYENANAYAVLQFYTNNSWNPRNYAAQPIQDSLRSDEQTSNGGLEFQHLRIAFERVSKKDYQEENYTRGSWAVFERAYNFAFGLLERYYDMTFKGITQAAITHARHELLSAERQLTSFTQLANFLQFDIAMTTKMEPAERDAMYYETGDAETPGTIDYLLAVLAEARVMSEERSSYDSSEQGNVDRMTAKMNEAYDLLIKKNIIYVGNGALAYLGYENPCPQDDAAENENCTWRIVYNLPYFLTFKGGTRNLIDYVYRFSGSGDAYWQDSGTFKRYLGLQLVGTGMVFKIRSGMGSNITTHDAVTVLIFGDIVGAVRASDSTMMKYGDSMVDAKDLQALDAYLKGQYTFTPMQKLAADVNHDGEINYDDRAILAAEIQNPGAAIEQWDFNWS